MNLDVLPFAFICEVGNWQATQAHPTVRSACGVMYVTFAEQRGIFRLSDWRRSIGPLTFPYWNNDGIGCGLGILDPPPDLTGLPRWSPPDQSMATTSPRVATNQMSHHSSLPSMPRKRLPWWGSNGLGPMDISRILKVSSISWKFTIWFQFQLHQAFDFLPSG